MTNLYLTEPDLIWYVLSAAAWLTVGALIGALHFVTLRWNVRMFAFGQTLLLALAIQLLRFAAIATVFAVVASLFGAMPLLVTTTGILAARTAVVRFGGRP